MEWIRLARGGLLAYIYLHIYPELLKERPLLAPKVSHRAGPRERRAQERAHARWEKWPDRANRFLALHWMCAYIDALCVPVMDERQLERIEYFSKKASWHWYRYLPKPCHTLLAHAMLHLAEQAKDFGPQCIFWLFHKERSPDHLHPHTHTHALGTGSSPQLLCGG